MAKYYFLAIKHMEIKDITLGLCLTLARIAMIKKTQPAWHSNTTGKEKLEYPGHNTCSPIGLKLHSTRRIPC